MEMLIDVFKPMNNIRSSRALYRRLLSFTNGFIHRNDDHVSFFGGHLTGVHKVIFTPSDRSDLFDHIFEVDEYLVKKKLKELPSVNNDWIVISDALNQTLVYFAHWCFNDAELKRNKVTLHIAGDKYVVTEAYHAAMLCIKILHIKFLTSTMKHFFPYLVDPNLGQATYDRLSLKSHLRKYGSWGAVLDMRSMDVVSPNSIHIESIKFYKKDEDILKVITDISTRIRNMLKIIRRELEVVRKEDMRQRTSSNTIEWDGESIVVDLEREEVKYRDYIHRVMPSRNDFIKKELMEIILREVKRAPPAKFREGLEYLSDNYHVKRAKVPEKIDLVLTHFFSWFRSDRSQMTNLSDLPLLLEKLSGVYSSSRSTEKLLFDLREAFETFISKELEIRTDSVVAALRNAILLYIVIRFLTKENYS